ncbi:hypothetical protein [Hymenobacter sp. UYP22]|uniref:hypothetical protein n=1 Tax=Hymenobacter sp. UYP22 TaxID=3156348 RepID=UPI003394830B
MNEHDTMSKPIPPNWTHLHAWWAENKKLYNVPEIAARAGLYKGRVYAALDPGSQGGSTARYTDELYEKLTAVLRTAYRPFAVPVNISEEKIRELYDEQGLGLDATAEKLGITMPSLRKYMNTLGIERRPVGAPEKIISFTVEQLRHFVHRNMSQDAAAVAVGLSKPAFLSRVGEVGFDWKEEVVSWKQLLWEDILQWAAGRQKAKLQMRGFFLTKIAMNIAVEQRLAPAKPTLLRMAEVFAADGFSSPYYILESAT